MFFSCFETNEQKGVAFFPSTIYGDDTTRTKKSKPTLAQGHWKKLEGVMKAGTLRDCKTQPDDAYKIDI